MSALLDIKRLRGGAVGLDWMPVAAGLLVLFVPTFYDAAMSFWQTDENAHGPIILAVIVWLIWSTRAALAGARFEPAPKPGIALLVFGLLVVCGRAVASRSRSFEIGRARAGARRRAARHARLDGPCVRSAFPTAVHQAFMLPLPGHFPPML